MPDPPNHSSYWAVPVAIILVALASYAPALKNNAPYVLDDHHTIVDRVEIRSPVALNRIWKGTLSDEDFYRPMFYTSLAFNLWFQGDSGTRPDFKPGIIGLRVVNLLLHAGTWILVFSIVLRLIEASRGRSSTTMLASGAVALIGAALPACSQAVLYISARSSLQMTFFAVLAFRLYMSVRIPRSVLTKIQMVTRYSAMLLALAAAILTKEAGAVIPVIFLVFEFMRSRFETKPKAASPEPKPEPTDKPNKSGQTGITADTGEKITGLTDPGKKSKQGGPTGGLFAAAFSLFPVFVISGALLALHAYKYISIERYGAPTLPYSPWRYFLTELPVIARYIQLYIIPIGLSVHHVVPAAEGFSPGVIAAGVFLLLVLSGGVVLAWKRPLAAFGIFWFFLALAPTSSFFPIWDAMFEHRMYFPAVGFLIAVVPAAFYGIRAYEIRSSGKESLTSIVLPSMVFGLLAFILIIITALRAADWRDAERFWKATEKAEPKSYYAKSGLARIAENRMKKPDVDQNTRNQAQKDMLKYLHESRELWAEYLGEERWNRKLYIRAEVEYAKALRRTGNNSGALAELTEVERHGGDERVPEVLLHKGLILRQIAITSKTAEQKKNFNLMAGEALHNYLNHRPDKLEAHLHFLDILKESGNIDMLVNATMDALHFFPDDLRFLQKRIYALAKLKRYPEAYETYRNILANNKFGAGHLWKEAYNFAEIMYNCGKFKEALPLVEEARGFADKLAHSTPGTGGQTQSEANIARLEFLMLVLEAKIKNRMGRLDDVIEMLKKALKIDPNSSEAYDGLINAYFRKNDLPRMRETLLVYLDIQKNKPDTQDERIKALLALSGIASRNGKHEEAKRWLLTALEEKPDDEALKKRLNQVEAEAEAAKNPPKKPPEKKKPENNAPGKAPEAPRK